MSLEGIERQVKDRYEQAYRVEWYAFRNIDGYFSNETNPIKPSQNLYHRRVAMNMIDRNRMSRHLGSELQVYPRPSQYLISKSFEYLSKIRGDVVEEFYVDTLLPLAGLEKATESAGQIGLRRHSLGDSCDEAENYFESCLTQIEHGVKVDQNRISVYHDNDERPLLFRKSYYDSSALTLENIDANGISVPAGTIVAVNGTSLNLTGSSGDKFKLERYKLDETKGIRPIRISPWAYEDPIDRGMFSLENGGDILDKDRFSIVAGHTLEEFRNAAAYIMEECRMVRIS